MERLTIRNSDGTVSQPTSTRVCDVFHRLAEYEDTGLTPEEVTELLAMDRGVCLLCGSQNDDEVPGSPKVNGCRHTECSLHRWRDKWYKEDGK